MLEITMDPMKLAKLVAGDDNMGMGMGMIGGVFRKVQEDRVHVKKLDEGTSRKLANFGYGTSE